MQIHFETRDPQAASLRGLATGRLQFVLRRVQWLVPRATLRLSDVNGPRGGVDKRCQVELDTDGGGKVVIASLARDWRSAIDAALARAARALLRLWQRNRQPARAGRTARAGRSGRGDGQPDDLHTPAHRHLPLPPA